MNKKKQEDELYLGKKEELQEGEEIIFKDYELEGEGG